MSRKCDICGRGPRVTITRSHSHIATRRRQLPNLQKKTVNGKSMKVCTSCIRTMNKTK